MTKHSHYYKDVKHLDVIDVYRVIALWEVQDPCLQHLIKKALCAGGRGHKDKLKDLQDIVDSAQRALDMHIEDTSERIDPREKAFEEALGILEQCKDNIGAGYDGIQYQSAYSQVAPYLEGCIDELLELKEDNAKQLHT